MDAHDWIQLLGIGVVGGGLLASAGWAIVKAISKKINDSNKDANTRFDKVDFQFSRVDLKFDAVQQQFNDKFGQVTEQIDKLKDVGNDRHIANIERLARLEGQISALPQRIDSNGSYPLKPKS